jgi:hypothetical protein
MMKLKNNYFEIFLYILLFLIPFSSIEARDVIHGFRTIFPIPLAQAAT